MDLAVQKREAAGKKVKLIRREWIIPGIVYGKYLEWTMTVSFDKQSFLRLYKKGWTSIPLTLKGEGIDQLVLIHDIQVDPVTSMLLHVDFLTLKKWEKIKTSVSIILEGEAPVEKLGEGKVQLVKDEIEVESIPQNLPHDIKVDISVLATIQDGIFVKDLIVDKGVEIIDDSEIAVVIVSSMSAETEEVEEETSAAGEEAAVTEKTEWWDKE